MKITDVHPFVVDGGFRNWVFVRVTTDEGLVGYGEATVEGREHAVLGTLKDLNRVVVGQAADEIRRLVHLMTRHGYWESGPVVSSAIGGIEIALWDIAGKSLDAPVYRLLGGALRAEVPVYSNAWYFGADTPDEFAQAAVATCALDYGALKFDPFGRSEYAITDRELGVATDRIAAVRHAVGRDVAIMIEGHGRFSYESALQIARRVEQYGVRFFEEPVIPGDIEAFGRLAAATSIPLAAGERCYDLRDCLRLIKAGAAVIQPDVIHIGGISRLMAVAELAEATAVSLAPHNASGPVATAATLQVAAVSGAFFLQEMFAPRDTGWKDRVAFPGLRVVNGHVAIPTGTGIGVTIDEAEAARHPYEVRDLNLMGEGSILERPADGAGRSSSEPTQ
ncbi:MAG: mandelate racemase/muconate lactonizing enzyme family protein [Acidimicrobiales bacterium]